jgi:NADH-quinone oxidoreductase subunit E
MALAFTDEDRAKIGQIVGRYPNKPAALLPVLHYAQDKFGHLAPEVQLLVAHAIDVPPPRVREVVTFYEMYHEHPEGQFHLEVCTNISCHLMGGDAVLDHLRKKLGIECGEHTPDGMFSLMEAECLASCGSGSCMKVGRDYYEFLTIESVDALVEQLKKQAPELKGRPYVQAKDGPHVGPVKGFAPAKTGGREPRPGPEGGREGRRQQGHR